MRQRPAPLLFGMISDMVQRAGGSMALTDDYSELEDSLQGHHLPPTMIRDPQAIATLFTGLPKRRQGGPELRFGLGCSPRHRVPPACNKGQHYHLNVHLVSSGVFRSAEKNTSEPSDPPLCPSHTLIPNCHPSKTAVDDFHSVLAESTALVASRILIDR